jgi:hypothetical protein
MFHMPSDSYPSAVRYALGGLLAFGAVNAFGGGFYGLTGARGIPTEWLSGSPFTDYVIPSLILFVIVGGALLGAAVAVFGRRRSARAAAFIAGTILLVWVVVETAVIGYVSWLQPATLTAGLLVLALAWRLPKPRPSPEWQPQGLQ